jgi:hypothetical protein
MEWTGRQPAFFRKTAPKLELLRKGLGSGALPLKDFVRLTQAEFMGNQDLYSEALGLSHFLLNADAGRFRERFLGFLREVIQGRGAPGLFEETFREDVGAIEAGWLPFASGAGK